MQVELLDMIRGVLAANNLQLTKIQAPFEELVRFDFGLRKSLDPEFDWQWFGNSLLENIPERTLMLVEGTFELRFAMFRLPDQEDIAYVAGPWRVGGRSPKHRRWAITALGEDVDTAIEEYFNGVLLSKEEHFIGTIQAMLLAAYPPEVGRPDFSVTSVKEFLPLDFRPDIRYFSQPEFHQEIPMAMLEERYENENRLMDAVSRGDENLALILIHERGRFRYSGGRFYDELSQIKWGMIILNTLLRKAIEKTKIHPYYIDQISAMYGHRIEMMAETDHDTLKIEMIKGYCAYVREYSLRQYSPIIQKVINYINLNLGAPLSLKMLAEMCFISPSYLSNLFKQETGVTLIDYISSQRVKRAAGLLTDTHYPISAIAEEVGILDVNYFTKIFKKAMGQTPSQYRKESRVKKLSLENG